MLKFNTLKIAIDKQLIKMIKGDLFKVDIDKKIMWNTYLDSFPEGTNKIFRKNRKYDCNCCKSFIKTLGNAVTISNNKLISIWDIEVGGQYQPVVDALSKLIKSKTIKDTFLHFQNECGQNFTNEITDNGSIIKWQHFHFKLPDKFVSTDREPILSNSRTNKEVFKKGLEVITLQSIETVLELIEQKTIYRGDEFKPAVEQLLKYKKKYDSIIKEEQDNFCWSESAKIGRLSRIANSLIGTLLLDISEDVFLDVAVIKYEKKAAPENYKRTTAIVTKGMIKKAKEEIIKLGFENSLERRFATVNDITIDDILFADRTTKQEMGVFDDLIKEAPLNVKNLNKVEEVNIETFIDTILPKADGLEIMFQENHTANLMSLIAPQNNNSKKMFKWDNNFSWTYNGEVADSMREHVKKAGGRVDGILRYSIMWNNGDNNQNDFDAHAYEPNKNKITFTKKGQIQVSSGMLDVDIINPGNNIAVENIIYTDIKKMPIGIYEFVVHNYSHNGGHTGFKAEIEFNKQIFQFDYTKELKNKQKVTVAKVKLDKNRTFKIIESLDSTTSSKKIWGITTNQFHKVSMIMNSPNYWAGKMIGNKHYFIILENCINPKDGRGFYNEFLSNKLTEHRKTMEMVGAKMRAPYTIEQLSGLGFSSTQRNKLFCKITGNFTRIIKINF